MHHSMAQPPKITIEICFILVLVYAHLREMAYSYTAHRVFIDILSVLSTAEEMSLFSTESLKDHSRIAP